MTISKGHNSTKGDNSDLKKKLRQLFFDAESSMKTISLILKGQMDKPKAICPFNFFPDLCPLSYLKEIKLVNLQN